MSKEHPDLTLAYMTGYAKGRAVAERDAKDAARYRHQREHTASIYLMTPEELDEMIDAAMSVESTKPNVHKNEPKLNMTPLAQFLLDDALTDKTDWKENK